MYQNKKNDFETHKATIDLDHGKGAWDYKSRSKAKFYDHTTKQQFDPRDFANWINSPHIKNMIQRGANLKIATQDIEDNPTQYSDGLKRRIIFYYSMPKNGFTQKTNNVDGLKPISQAMPPHATQFAPDHAKPVEQSDMDDEIPF